MRCCCSENSYGTWEKYSFYFLFPCSVKLSDKALSVLIIETKIERGEKVGLSASTEIGTLFFKLFSKEFENKGVDINKIISKKINALVRLNNLSVLKYYQNNK